ncbi:MAG: hypothetical protein R2716_02250 [Microthrixaceae bacterium]
MALISELHGGLPPRGSGATRSGAPSAVSGLSEVPGVEPERHRRVVRYSLNDEQRQMFLALAEPLLR